MSHVFLVGFPLEHFYSATPPAESENEGRISRSRTKIVHRFKLQNLQDAADEIWDVVEAVTQRFCENLIGPLAPRESFSLLITHPSLSMYNKDTFYINFTRDVSSVGALVKKQFQSWIQSGVEFDLEDPLHIQLYCLQRR